MNATHLHRAGVWLISPSGTTALPSKRGRVYIYAPPACGGWLGWGARGVVMELKSKSLVQERFGAFAATYATSRPHARGNSLLRLVELVAPRETWIALDIATGAG